MRVAALRVEYHIPAAHSLKGKRRPLKSLLERLRTRLHCDAAEVAYQDMHQRAAIGVVLVAPDAGHLRDRLHALKRELRSHPEMRLLSLREAEYPEPERESFMDAWEVPPDADS